MTQFLPPNLLALFAPRDPIKYLPPTEKLPFEKRTRGYSGVAAYLDVFEVSVFAKILCQTISVSIYSFLQSPEETPAPVKIESREEKVERKVCKNLC